MEGVVVSMEKRCKEKLFAYITASSFVLDDLRLFLDTHPNDKEALDYWRKVEKGRNEAVEEYTKCYGPISAYNVDAKNYWTWVDEPWPWEVRC